jgi:hypothetical protein
MSTESHTLAWMRKLDEKFDRLDAKVTDIKGDTTVLTGIVLRLEGRDSGMPVELAGVRLKLAELQRRIDQIEASQAKPSP